MMGCDVHNDRWMHASLDVNIPSYASAIVTTDEIVDSIFSLDRRNQRRRY